MKAKLIQCVEGHFIATEVDADNILEAFEVRGYTYSHLNFNTRQRTQLQGHPVFKELCGPMWDGNELRYEDQRANDHFST